MPCWSLKHCLSWSPHHNQHTLAAHPLHHPSHTSHASVTTNPCSTRLCNREATCMQGASGISPMQKLCLLKLVRPECLVSAIQQYVVASLGPRFAEPGPTSLAQVSKDSNNTTPIIFILSAGQYCAEQSVVESHMLAVFETLDQICSSSVHFV